MRKALNSIESGLGRFWPLILIGMLMLVAWQGCAGLGLQDVVDAGSEAVSEVDPEGVVDAVSSGNWLYLLAVGLGAVGTFIGVLVKKKKRKG